MNKWKLSWKVWSNWIPIPRGCWTSYPLQYIPRHRGTDSGQNLTEGNSVPNYFLLKKSGKKQNKTKTNHHIFNKYSGSTKKNTSTYAKSNRNPETSRKVAKKSFLSPEWSVQILQISYRSVQILLWEQGFNRWHFCQKSVNSYLLKCTRELPVVLLRDQHCKISLNWVSLIHWSVVRTVHFFIFIFTNEPNIF